MQYDDFRNELLQDLLANTPLLETTIKRDYEDVEEHLVRMQKEGLIRRSTNFNRRVIYYPTREGLRYLQNHDLGLERHWADLAIALWRDE